MRTFFGLSLLGALVLSACLPSQPVDCDTPTGVALDGSKDCDGLYAHVIHSLGAFQRHVGGWTRPETDKRIKGWHVHIVTEGVDPDRGSSGAWYSYELHQWIAGETWCEANMSSLSSADWPKSALTHEMAHVLENCIDPGHTQWEAKGIFAAIQDANQPGGQ
jgi:hypothetical protein